VKKTIRASASAAAACLLLGLLASSGCSRTPQPAAPAGEASRYTVAAHQALAGRLDLDAPDAMQDAQRGFIAAPEGQVRSADGRVIWDFGAFAFVSGEPPPTVNPALWRQAALNNQAGLFQVTEGVWQLRGFDLANMTLIEGEQGWIVVDPLTARETAAAALAFARRHLGDRPVTAVVFTHSHADHFGGVLGVVTPEEIDARGIPVVAPAGFMAEATSENLLAGPAMTRRSLYMYGDRLPRSATGLVDNGLGKAVAYGTIGLLPPTLLIRERAETHVLDGVPFVFHNMPGAEAPAELTFSLPAHKAFCGAELLSHTLHNLYTLRGAKVRDSLQWAAYLDQILALAAEAEVLFNQHHWPVWGTANIREFITLQRDVYRYIHDQSVRLMNAGLNGAEIAEALVMPPTLDRFLSGRGYYGTVKHNARAVYQRYMGWYDAHPANLDALPPADVAGRYVALMGGPAATIAAAETAYEQGEYRWAAELLKHAVYAAPEDDAARELLARTFEQLGYQAEAASWRNAYLTGALELRLGPPERGVTRDILLDMLQHAPVERFLEAMAAALDGPAAAGQDLRINLVFRDRETSYVLWIENAVLHHREAPPDPAADATLTLTHGFFLRMMTGSAGPVAMLTSDETAIDGSRIALARFFRLLEPAPGTFAIVTP
jgi:alkyl sulfatase BDS1-like metallo-beta-lactamase superfamily hydrolase